jgi:hypothetical protein
MVALGEKVCERLKDIYFSDQSWQVCYKEVAVKFTELKRIMRKFYTDKSDMDILKEVASYDTMDIQEIFDSECST